MKFHLSERLYSGSICPPLAEAGISIRYNTLNIRKPESWDTKPIFHKNLDTRVSILKMHPGITPQIVRTILCGNDTRAVIISPGNLSACASQSKFPLSTIAPPT